MKLLRWYALEARQLMRLQILMLQRQWQQINFAAMHSMPHSLHLVSRVNKVGKGNLGQRNLLRLPLPLLLPLLEETLALARVLQHKAFLALWALIGVAGNLASQLGLNNILSNPLSAGTQFADWGTVPGIETPSASPQTAETAHQTLTDVVSKDQTPAEAVQSALNNAANNGLNQTTTALMAAIAATTAAAQQGLGPQAAVQALVDKGMDPHQAQSFVGNILSRAAAENTTAFQTPGIANFLHGLTNQFTQLFSAPPGPPQDIAREAPFIGDVAAGKGNPAVSIETASGKGVHDISIETASGKGGLDNIAIAPASVSQAPNLSDLYAVATPDLSSQLGLNDININDFGPASPGFEASGPTETTFDVGPSQQVSPTAGPYATQYDAGPQAQLSPVENISPLPSVEINPQFLDPVGPSIELSPYSPSLSPTAPAPAPSPSSNPAISHAPPAAQLNNNQSAQILLAAGLPAQSLDAFASSGLSPRKLLQLLQEGWDANKITDMVSRFASDEGHDPDYVDRPARGLERELGRDSIPSRKHHYAD
jgi:hypothetical protein